MAMWKRTGSALFGAVAVATVVGLSAASAMAAPATTLKARVSGGGSITATAGKTVLKDGLVSVTCTSSKSVGSISNGTHKGGAPLKVGTAKTLSFKNCTGPLGTVSNSPSKLPYAISVNGPTKSGNTAGVIGPVNVAVSTAGCTFTVTGSAPGYYNSTKHLLVLTPKLPKGLKELSKPKLTIGNVSGCPGGIIANGQHPTFTTTYKVNKKVKITVTG